MWPQRYHCITESTECENWEKDRTGRRKERKTETEREAQQGGWNTITALWLVGCYNTPPTLAAILWAWPPRSPWSPDSLRPSWCRRVCAAPCTRSWWTPAGRRISLWTCAREPHPLPSSWWRPWARPTSWNSTFFRTPRSLTSRGRSERHAVNTGMLSVLNALLKFRAVKRLIVINRIQNKSFGLHNICVCTVYIYFVYKLELSND